MDSVRLQNQIRLIEEMKKIAEQVREVGRLSKSLASKTRRITIMNASSTDNLMSSLKMKIGDINKTSESDISEIVVREVERQLGIEIDLANSYRELEERTRRMKHSVSETLQRFSPNDEFGQLPMIQAVKNYHDAVAANSRKFNGVPMLTKKLLKELRESSVSGDGIRDLSVLKDKLKQQYEILRRAKGRVGQNSETTFLNTLPSHHDLESAGWQCLEK